MWVEAATRSGLSVGRDSDKVWVRVDRGCDKVCEINSVWIECG